LPDAHSQALTPVSALLSGVLLKTSVYAILRFSIITNKSLGPGYVSGLFIIFGLLSVAVAAVFLLVQKDIKRFLAYSSIEHIGIIIFGLGVGGPIAIFRSLFHVLNHAMAKSLMFFSAGHLVKKYKSHNMHLMHGALSAIPFAAVSFILGAMILGGMPPFGMFVSKFMIFSGAFERGFYWQAGVMLGFLSVVFGALIFYLPKVIFGNKPRDITVENEPIGARLIFSSIIIILFVAGIYIPTGVWRLMDAATNIITGS
ncbi:MAG TPA: proton-conducting transporter membrane subunit, partial [Candidatus Omnitrophota bacterium]|nr:proton-conducting transporter membrane subunit [Candidatus Omnitrophota bacterium]